MPAVPIQRTWLDGDALTTTNLNGHISDPIEFLLTPPIARLRQTSVQSIPNNTLTPVIFTTEDVDTDMDGVGGHSTSTNPSRFTARYPGWYLCSGGVTFASNATGIRLLRWGKNGSDILGSDVSLPPVSGNVSRYSARTILVSLNIADFVELLAFQNSGAALSTVVGTGEQSDMNVVWEAML